MTGTAKFPRIPHLPWSPGGTRDDRRVDGVAHLLGRRLVVTEKLDGSNLCMTREDVFARSHSGAPRHPSFDAAKALHARVRHLIPRHLSVFGEWCWAVHSIEYDGLEQPFNVFAARDDEAEVWLAWSDVREQAQALGLVAAPELGDFVSETEGNLRAATDEHGRAPSRYGPVREGVVLRLAGPVADAAFDRFFAKWVREDHVQTDEHWSKGDFRRHPLRYREARGTE